jgi:hypothetical protein
MKVDPKDLIFISKINPDGSGVVKIHNPPMVRKKMVRIRILSPSQKTFIYNSYAVYVVKLKPDFKKL